MIEVLNVSPSAGIIDPTAPLLFDVRTDDPNTFTRIIVGVYFAGARIQEFVYAGDPTSADKFLPYFLASTVTAVADAGYSRFRFEVRRNAAEGQPMWIDSPLLVVYAFNSAGEEV